MATFKPVVRTDKEFNAVYIRIIAFTKPAYIKTSMIVHKSGIEKGEITDYSILGNCYIQIKEYTEKLNNVNTENWTATEIKDFLMKGKEDISFTDFADDFIKQMRNDDRDKQATNYKASVTSLKKHLKKENLLFSDITSNEISKWLKSLEKTARAKQLYPTHINKIFKSGMREFNDYERDIIRIKYNPFELVKIPSADAPKKRFADLDVVHKILAATPMYEREKQAQDVVRLILCLAGINTVDLYNMEKDEFIDGKFCYNRTKEEKIRKDKAYFEIKVPELILPILEKYQGKKNFFIFRERYSDADGFATAVRKGLKSICKRAEIKLVSPYWFRHTWATIARNECGASIEEVAFCLNHASAHKVTEFYIEKDFSSVDKINNKVIDRIFN